MASSSEKIHLKEEGNLPSFKKHPDQSKKSNVCKQGKQCKHYPKCIFEHPPGTIPECKFGNSCTRKGCLFEHPAGYIPGESPVIEPKQTTPKLMQTTRPISKVCLDECPKVNNLLDSITPLPSESRVFPIIYHDEFPKIYMHPADPNRPLITSDKDLTRIWGNIPVESNLVCRMIITDKVNFSELLIYYCKQISRYSLEYEPQKVAEIFINKIKEFANKTYKQLSIIKEYLILRKEQNDNFIIDDLLNNIKQIEHNFNEVMETREDDYIITLYILIKRMNHYNIIYDEFIEKYNHTKINEVNIDESHQLTYKEIMKNIINSGN